MTDVALRKKMVGTALRTYREGAELTQWEIAEKLGYSTAQFISNWERGVSLPPDDSYKKLGKLLGVAPTKLVGLVFDYKAKALVEEKAEALRAAK